MHHHHDMGWNEYVRHTIGDDRQVDVARKTGVDQGTVSRWLRDGDDVRRAVSPQAVRAFARAYGRPTLEAFVASGHLTPDEAGIARPQATDWSSVSDEELAAEVRRRLCRTNLGIA